MSNDKIAVPTGMALTHLDPVFRERPNEYLDVLRSGIRCIRIGRSIG
jgi:hypothetical protein